MGVRTTSSEEVVAIFDSVTGWAFGPTFSNEEEADSFLAFVSRWGGRDARSLSDAELENVYAQWLKAGKHE
jgi:hypothetical protein